MKPITIVKPAPGVEVLVFTEPPYVQLNCLEQKTKQQRKPYIKPTAEDVTKVIEGCKQGLSVEAVCQENNIKTSSATFRKMPVVKEAIEEGKKHYGQVNWNGSHA